MSSTEKYMGEMRFPKTKNGFTSSSSIAALIGMTERRAIHQGRDLPSVMIISSITSAHSRLKSENPGR